MRVFRSAAELRGYVTDALASRRRVGLVPTMGNLHAGHHSLVEIARGLADLVVASVFVNPTQFGPNEDFARYPRTPEADIAGLEASGCDALFLPTVDELYPYGSEHGVRVRVPDLTEILEGAIRPGHFDGVATVVAKLFNLVQPQVAVFGRKDYQQLLVIRRLVRDMGYPVDVVAAPIVREADGLAMSSRNQYLDPVQRAQAAEIHRSLQEMAAASRRGVEPGEVESMAMRRLSEAGFVPDYAVVRRGDDLREVAAGDRERVALIAARLGATRLIDNLAIDL